MAKAKKDWKSLLTDCLELRGKSGIFAYKRAVALKAVAEDEGYREFCVQEDEDSVRYLDQYVEDLCLTHLQLQDLLAEHPEESDWRTGKLTSMYDAMLKKIAAEQTFETSSTPRTEWKKTATEAEEKLADVEYENVQLKKTESDNRERLSSYEQEIRDLKEDNAVLRGRIEELEKLHKPELVTA